MPSLADDGTDLQAHLDRSIGEHGVPGAVIAIVRGDERLSLASGIANVNTGVPTTVDTLFQIASISKLYTTTLVAQVVDQGLVELDSPVRAVLHEFRVRDDSATLSITPRHLLTHTSGIEGDHFFDCGRNPDALWRYVSTLDEIGQVHPPDDLYSYCNSGFAVAGRMIEEVTGDHFGRALRRRLIKPLGVTHTVVTTEHAIVHRVAAGHRQAPGTAPSVQPWMLGTFNIPMGGIIATADDVLTFARLYLDKGRSAAGKQVVPARVLAGLLEPQVEHPDGVERCLGWENWRWGDVEVFGHDGDAIGQRAYFRMLPSEDSAIVLLTNSMIGGLVARDLLAQVAGDLFDLPVPEIGAVDPSMQTDAARFVGTYERLHQTIEIAGGDGGLFMSVIPDELFAASGQQTVTLPLEPVDDMRFRTSSPATGLDAWVCFVDPDDRVDHPGYVHWGGRAHRRTDP